MAIQIGNHEGWASGVMECLVCKGSGEVALDYRTLAFRYAGPVEEDARGVTAAVCKQCGGMGVI